MDHAAQLALRICRFVQMPLNSPDWPREWRFVPGGGRADREEAIKLLVDAPKPVIIAPLVEPGMLATWCVANMSGEPRRRVDHDFANEVGWVERFAAELSLSETDEVIFDSASDRFMLTLIELRAFFRDVAVIAGWMLMIKNF
jgi:hypothetical protein